MTLSGLAGIIFSSILGAVTDKTKYKRLLLAFLTALAALPVRALIAGYFHSPEIMVIIQILDGVGAGFMGVVVPVITANILANTGRINTGMGILMTMQAAGGALSTTYAGILAARFNYSAAFIGLAFMAFAALFVFIFSYKFVKGFAVK